VEQKLFVYGFNEKANRWEILDREFQKVKRKLRSSSPTSGSRIIEVIDGNFENRGELLLATGTTASTSASITPRTR